MAFDSAPYTLPRVGSAIVAAPAWQPLRRCLLNPPSLLHASSEGGERDVDEDGLWERGSRPSLTPPPRLRCISHATPPFHALAGVSARYRSSRRPNLFHPSHPRRVSPREEPPPSLSQLNPFAPLFLPYSRGHYPNLPPFPIFWQYGSGRRGRARRRSQLYCRPHLHVVGRRRLCVLGRYLGHSSEIFATSSVR